jgi:hypothetical protein
MTRNDVKVYVCNGLTGSCAVVDADREGIRVSNLEATKLVACNCPEVCKLFIGEVEYASDVAARDHKYVPWS